MFYFPQFPQVTTKEIPLTHPVVHFRYDDSLLLAIRQDGLLYLFADFSSVRFRQQEPMKSIPQFTIQFNQPVYDIGIAGNTVYVLTTEGNLYSYGDPSKNLKPLSCSNPFHQVLSTDHFISIHSSHNNFIALASNGTVYLISHDKSFQNTSSFQVFSTSQITRINDLEVRKIIDVAVSNRNLVFITSDGEAYIHGYNDNAQCLTPTTSNFESLFHMAKPTCGLDQLHCYRARQAFVSNDLLLTVMQKCKIDESDLETSTFLAKKAFPTESPGMLVHGGRARANFALEFVNSDDCHSPFDQPYFRRVQYVKSHPKKSKEKQMQFNFSIFENMFKDAVQDATLQNEIDTGVAQQNDRTDPIQSILRSAYEEYVHRNYSSNQ